MITERALRRSLRPLRNDATMHLFSVGQTVRRKGNPAWSLLPVDIFTVVARLPPRGDSPQYRIRSDDERHERVTTQDDLEPVDIVQSGGSATLIERTFGNGQRTAA